MSLGSLLRRIGVTLGVLGSFMKRLGHQNRKKDVYDGDCWGVMGAKREAKEGPATNLQHFGATLGPLWVYGGDFGSLWDHYVMIVESLWV